MNRQFIKEIVRVFIFAFLGAFIPLLQGIWLAPDWNAQKAALVAALVAAFSAGVKALTDILTKGVAPAPNVGILSPNVK
jgi:hypothetical protein